MYKEYCSLLLSVAQQYDMQHSGKVDKFAKQWVYQHGMFDSDATDHEFYDTSMYDIDQPIEPIMVNFTRSQGPQLPYKQWKELPDEAKRIWNQLSPEAKAMPPPKFDPNKN